MMLMRRTATTPLACFILTMPFLHALSLFPWLPLPLVVATSILLLAAASLGWSSLIGVLPEDWLLIGCWTLGVAALSTHMGYLGSKNVTHSLAVITSVGVYFIGLRNWIARVGVDWDALGRAASWCALLLSIAVCGEFVLTNTTGLYFSDLMPFNVDQFQATETIFGLKRPRGFAAEPSFTAMVFDLLLPLAYMHLSRARPLIRGLWVCAVLPGLLLLFSAGSIVSLGLAVLIVAIARTQRPMRSLIACGLIAILIACLFQIQAFVDAFDFVVGRKLEDLFVRGDVDVSTHLGRNEAYRAAFVLIGSEPLGVGWGAVSQMFDSGVALPGQTVLPGRGLLSLYLEIGACTGVLGLLMFGVFQGVKIAAVWRSTHPYSTYLLVGVLALSIHHAFVLEIWFPMLWFSLALVDRMRMDEFARLAAFESVHHQRIQSAEGGATAN
jgi:O-antigen ligase/polysaccharide polymerase Wzy-like membrane protein